MKKTFLMFILVFAVMAALNTMGFFKPITLGGITWACIAISSFLLAIVFKGYIDPARSGAPEPDKPAAVQQAGAVK